MYGKVNHRWAISVESFLSISSKEYRNPERLRKPHPSVIFLISCLGNGWWGRQPKLVVFLTFPTLLCIQGERSQHELRLLRRRRRKHHRWWIGRHVAVPRLERRNIRTANDRQRSGHRLRSRPPERLRHLWNSRYAVYSSKTTILLGVNRKTPLSKVFPVLLAMLILLVVASEHWLLPLSSYSRNPAHCYNNVPCVMLKGFLQ